MSITKSRVEVNESRWIFAPKVYDFLKDSAQIYIPALGVAYAGLAGIWHWGYVLEVSGTVLVIDTLLGTILKISKTVYDNSDRSKDGDLNLEVSSSGVSVEDVLLNTPVSDLANKERVVLDVTQQDSTQEVVNEVKMDPRLIDNN